MNPKSVRLTLVFPPTLEAAITEALASNPQVPGFTILHAQGHGHDFANASTTEIVRGRIDQRVLWIITSAETPPLLLSSLKEKVPSPEVVWWVEPLIDFGRMI